MSDSTVIVLPQRKSFSEDSMNSRGSRERRSCWVVSEQEDLSPSPKRADRTLLLLCREEEASERCVILSPFEHARVFHAQPKELRRRLVRFVLLQLGFAFRVRTLVLLRLLYSLPRLLCAAGLDRCCAPLHCPCVQRLEKRTTTGPVRAVVAALTATKSACFVNPPHRSISTTQALRSSVHRQSRAQRWVAETHVSTISANENCIRGTNPRRRSRSLGEHLACVPETGRPLTVISLSGVILLGRDEPYLRFLHI